METENIWDTTSTILEMAIYKYSEIKMDMELDCAYQLAVSDNWTAESLKTVIKAHNAEFKLNLTDDALSKITPFLLEKGLVQVGYKVAFFLRLIPKMD